MKTIEPSDIKRWLRRPRVFLPLGGLLLTGIVLFALPFVLQYALAHWLVANGAESADIRRVRCNLFTGMVRLEGVRVEQQGKEVFSDTTILVNIDLGQLFRRHLVLEQVRLDTVHLDAAMDEQGRLRLGSIVLPPADKDTGDEPIREQAQATDSGWLFSCRRLELNQVVVRYRQPEFAIDLKVEDALLSNFSLAADTEQPAGLQLHGQYNGATVEADLTTLQLVPALNIQGKVLLDGVRLDGLAGLLRPYLDPFAGTAVVDGAVELRMEDSATLSTTFDGRLDLDQGAIGGSGWSTKGSVHWQGPASFAMTPETMTVEVDGKLLATKAEYAMPDPVMTIANDRVAIEGKSTVRIGAEVMVDSEAALTLDPTSYQAQQFHTGAGATSWQGKVHVATGTPSRGLLVRVDGQLDSTTPFFSLDLDQAAMEVGNGRLNWQGQVEYAMAADRNQADTVKTSGTLEGSRLHFRYPEVVQVAQENLRLVGDNAVTLGATIGVDWQGDITLGGSQVEVADVRLSDGQVNWSGHFNYLLGATEQTLALGGRLQADQLAAALGDPTMLLQQESLASTADCVLTLTPAPTMSGQASLQAQGLTVHQGEEPIAALKQYAIGTIQGGGQGGFAAESMEFDELEVPVSSLVPVQLLLPQLRLNGLRSSDLAEVDLDRLEGQGLEVWSASGQLLAALQSLTAQPVKLSGDGELQLKQIVLESARFLEQKADAFLASLQRAEAKEFSYSREQGGHLSLLSVEGLFANLQRDKSDEQPAATGQGPEEAPPAARSDMTLPIRIDRVTVDGASGFTFIDTSLAKRFKTTFDLEQFEATGLDFTQPATPFTYTLKGSFDTYSPLTVSGSCAPLASQLLLNQQLVLRNYSMLQLSPYTVQTIGTYFPSGTLDLTSSLDIEGDKLVMENNLLFTDLETETVNGELAGELQNQLPVPLGLAVTMLEQDGKIDLDVPIDGALSDLHVGVSDLVLTAMGKAITVAVTPYLAYAALGPAGALTFLGAAVGKELLATGLPNLVFAPGERELTEAHQATLQEVGQAMAEDGEGTYSICAKVAVDELVAYGAEGKEDQDLLDDQAIRQELFELGEARSLAVKSYLTGNFAIDQDRLLICNPGILFKQGQKPVVEFRK